MLHRNTNAGARIKLNPIHQQILKNVFGGKNARASGDRHRVLFVPFPESRRNFRSAADAKRIGRTPDRRCENLSIRLSEKMVGATGIEPVTPTV